MSHIQFTFSLEATDANSSARAGAFTTAHSTTLTPAFMPVATHAAMRSQPIEALKAIGFKTILANTYHLLLRPGAAVFEAAGGIHPFMQWPHSVLTDSGGFQIFSLSRYLKMSEEGADFRSYVDGQQIILTPERSIAMQRAINSDIMMVLDQCVPALSDHATSETALELTYRWAKRSYDARGDSKQALFGIVQGACHHDLRKRSAEQITSIPFDGYAIGGVAVGEEKSIRDDVIAYTSQFLPADKPRYLMGVGTPLDILEGVYRGVDMFDCIMPTAFAQQGVCFTSTGKIDLRRGVFKMSQAPLDEKCRCSTCKTYTRSYLHHLIKIGEYLGGTLLGVHNLTFYFDLMEQIRSNIIAGTFHPWYLSQREILGRTDTENPAVTPKRKTTRVKYELGNYEIVQRAEYACVRQRSSGETMHSVTNPMVEAHALYVEQSKLTERLNHPEKVTIWDVGLGAAYNAMATIYAYEQRSKKQEDIAPLELVSFENDLDSLRLVLKHPSLFPHIRHQAPNALLEQGVWRSKTAPITWRLVEGDFLVEAAHEQEKPEIIYYDPFSYKSDTALWSVEIFKTLLTLSIPDKTSLFSYTAATRVRSAMLAAGWCVAPGIPMPPKEETTIAFALSSPTQAKQELLNERWLQRWEKSQSRFPLSETLTEIEMSKMIRTHPQFLPCTRASLLDSEQAKN